MNTLVPARSLRSSFQTGKTVVAAGVYDMISARIADRMGFEALYMTGYGTVASHLGLPDAGLATYTDMVGRVAQICLGTSTPLVADADTGYGGLLNVRHTMRGYEHAGARAIQIEDQEMPKRCGHTLGRRVIETREMTAKIKVALGSRRSDETLVIARTDARTSLGIDEAIRRGEAFARAGADLVFVESPESEEELWRIAQSLKGVRLVVNVVNGGARTPEMPLPVLSEMGYALAIYPGLAHKAAAAAIASAYTHLKQHGSAIGLATPLMPSAEMHQLLGFQDVWDFEAMCEREFQG